ALPVAERHVVRMIELADAGGVHDDGRTAEIAHERRGRLADRRRVRHVDGVGARPCTGCRRGTLGGVGDDVETRDGGALGGEAARGRRPEPGAGPRHDRRTIREAVGWHGRQENHARRPRATRAHPEGPPPYTSPYDNTNSVSSSSSAAGSAMMRLT